MNAHYKRRHLDFYIQEIRPQEDKQLRQELGEIVADAAEKKNQINQEDIARQIKDDVIDQFNSNFARLQNEVQSVREKERTHIQ